MLTSPKSDHKSDNELFVKSVIEVVCAIPRGKVLTYGEVASLAGKPSNARQVGKILSAAGFNFDIPCHRVVNSQGRTAPHWLNQIALLKFEDVTFSKENYVNMHLHHWQTDSLLESF